ncbi:MAG TPA: transporter substrate-binding domain-containing protein, partial [Aggregatilineales bacterium]|nr:transporter substrate-binding domain-containing protein [Aggregatilineales bacterium]
AAGEVDAIINDGPTSADIIASNPDVEAVIVGEPLTDEFYGIAVNPEMTDLLDTLNTSLANVIADGTYAEIYKQWFGQQPSAAFMPAEETTDEGAAEMTVDFTDPVSVVNGLLFTFFAAEDASEMLAFACKGAEESPLFPDNDTLAGFTGMSLVDASNLTLEVEEVEDGVVSVTAAEGSTVKLLIGENEMDLPIALLLGQLGIESIRLEQDDAGNWLVCPSTEDAE